MAITISLGSGIGAMDVAQIILRAMRDAPGGTQVSAAAVATSVEALNPTLTTYKDLLTLYDTVYNNIKNRVWT